MAVKQVLIYPDERLRQVSEPVEDFEAQEFKDLVQDLKDTMEAYRAQGLAAIQIGVPKRVLVIRTSEGDVKVFSNPVTREALGFVKSKEGCLSFPSVMEIIERHEDVTVRAYDEHGKEFECSLDEIDAVAIQHELDHLDGVLFIDHVSRLTKRFMLKRLNKFRRIAGL